MKRLVKFFCSVVVFGVMRAIEAVRRALGLPIRPTAAVLYYHSVRDEERSRFAAQMDDLLRFCRPIRADINDSLQGTHRYAAVTFDDGLQSTIDNAVPELAKRFIPCTLFIVSNLLGEIANWKTNGEDGRHRESVVSAGQLCNLSSATVTIGSHTLTHPVLTAVEFDIAKKEIVESREKLENLLGREVRLCRFPYGEFNEDLVECCRAAGYTRVFASVPKRAFSEPREFLVGRVAVSAHDWPLEFRLKLLGAYSWLPFAAVLRKALPGKGYSRVASNECRN